MNFKDTFGAQASKIWFGALEKMILQAPNVKNLVRIMDHLIINGALKENNHGKLDYTLSKRRSFEDIIGNLKKDYEEIFEENAKLDELQENMKLPEEKVNLKQEINNNSSQYIELD